jgi:hypothetical protein
MSCRCLRSLRPGIPPAREVALVRLPERSYSDVNCFTKRGLFWIAKKRRRRLGKGGDPAIRPTLARTVPSWSPACFALGPIIMKERG